MKLLRTLKSFKIFKSEIKKLKTYSGWCTFKGLSNDTTLMQIQSGRTVPLSMTPCLPLLKLCTFLPSVKQGRMLTTCQEWHHHLLKMATCLTPFYGRSRMFTIYQACHHVYYMSWMLPPLLHDTLSTTSHAWHLVYHLSCTSPCLPHIVNGTLFTTYNAWCHVYIMSCVTPCLSLCLPVEDGTRFATLSSMALWVPPVNHGTMSTIGQAWHYFYHRSSMALCLPVPHDLVYQQSSMTLCLTPCKASIMSTNHPYLYSFEKRKLFMGFFLIIINHRHAFPFLPWNIPFCHANNILTV